MAKSKRIATTSSDSIQLSPDQFAHFVEGDGLFIKDDRGKVVAFAHIDNLEGSLERVADADARTDALHLLSFLQVSLNHEDYLELDGAALRGLQCVLNSVEASLTRYRQ